MVYFEQVWGIIPDIELKKKFGKDVEYIGVLHGLCDKPHYHYLIFSNDVDYEYEVIYRHMDDLSDEHIKVFHMNRNSVQRCALYLFHMTKRNNSCYSHRTDKHHVDVDWSNIQTNMEYLKTFSDIDIDMILDYMDDLTEKFGSDMDTIYDRVTELSQKSCLNGKDIRWLCCNKDAYNMYNTLIKLSGSNTDLLKDL